MPPKKRGRPRKTPAPPSGRAGRQNKGPPGPSKAIVPYEAGPSANPPPTHVGPPKNRPTSVTELAPHIRAALLQHWPEEAVNKMLKETIPMRKVLFDLMVQCPPPPNESAPHQEASSSRPRVGPHCKCCPYHPGNKARRKKECYTCGEEGPRFRMTKCGRCRAWHHPECEGSDPKTEDDDPAFDGWNCEDCQAAIDAEDNIIEVSDDDDDKGATDELMDTSSEEESEEEDEPPQEDDFDDSDFSD